MSDYRFVLASGSPRRKQLFEQIGLEFEICPSKKEERITSTVPEKVCVELSGQKAMDVASQIKAYNESHPEITTEQDIIVIGADTIVTIDGEIIGKPKDEEQAAEYLRRLSGNTHSVYTGVTFIFIMKNGKAGEYSFFEKTDVTFISMDEDEIRTYVATGEPMDKAGAYGVQGYASKYVKAINGDFYNVMGLPLSHVYAELRNLGIKI